MISFFRRSVAFVLLLSLLPFLLMAGLIIKIRFPGPLFYFQVREGKDSVPFRIWKLRTMVAEAGPMLQSLLDENPDLAKEWRAFGCLKNDPRIAGYCGKVIRNLSLDELPQLWNICRGEMAFIGPRPLEIFLAESLPAEDRTLRSSVLPGLTGLWQVGPRSDINIRQMQWYDKLYIRRRTPSMDFYILIRTIKVIFKGTGI